MGRKALGALETTKSNMAILILNCSGQKNSTLWFQSLLFVTLPSHSLWHHWLLKTLSLSSAAKSKPIIAEPEIHGGHSLDGVTGFLVLMSEGLYKALEAAHGPGQANQVSAYMGVVLSATDLFQGCWLLSYGPSSTSVIWVLPELDACATSYQLVIMWELACQASLSRHLPLLLGEAC